MFRTLCDVCVSIVSLSTLLQKWLLCPFHAVIKLLENPLEDPNGDGYLTPSLVVTEFASPSHPRLNWLLQVLITPGILTLLYPSVLLTALSSSLYSSMTLTLFGRTLLTMVVFFLTPRHAPHYSLWRFQLGTYFWGCYGLHSLPVQSLPSPEPIIVPSEVRIPSSPYGVCWRWFLSWRQPPSYVQEQALQAFTTICCRPGCCILSLASWISTANLSLILNTELYPSATLQSLKWLLLLTTR